MRPLAWLLLLTCSISLVAGCDSTPPAKTLPPTESLTPTPKPDKTKPGPAARPSNKMDPNL